MIGDKLHKLRTSKKISSEELAEKIGVSRQSIQKWESGKSNPTIENLVAISELFNVSLDYLCDNKNLQCYGGRLGCEIQPSFSKQPVCECYSKELSLEYRQSYEEGKDIEKYRELFEATAGMADGKYKDRIADTLFDIVSQAPQRENFLYYEPSGIEAIRAGRSSYPAELSMPDKEQLRDKITGAWYGRICGCLMGKPVEGIKRAELHKILERTNNYPMTRYICREECTPEVAQGVKWNIGERAFPQNFGKMPCDDDTNYMIMGYRILECFGKDFTGENVAQMWVSSQVKEAYCTAERVAFRNFVNGYLPPESAEYKNPYREWIGAQIRGDFYGYINPCNPGLAADMAYRDASISHVKNGIYGEMWVSAMISAAFGCDDCEKIIRRAMAEIPSTSRLYEAISGVLDAFNSGMREEEFFRDFHRRWNEESLHEWCHTISNAEIVAACLLYGRKNYGRSVGMAVEQGFDTDCNGATVGSVLGVVLGMSRLPRDFTDFVCDTLCSDMVGFNSVSITEMADKTILLMNKLG